MFGAKSRLEQVLANLIDNAISFSPQDSNIFINLKSNKDTVHLTIKDEGPGFKETNTDRISSAKVYGPKGVKTISGKELRNLLDLKSTLVSFQLIPDNIETLIIDDPP